MSLALRIDVDVPFGFYRKIRVALNWLHNNYGIVPRLVQIGYLEYALKLNEYLREYGIPVTWFFRTLTTPSIRYMHLFKNKYNNINIHIEQTQSFESFTKEVREWEKRCRTKATGFTKHGSGELKLSQKHDSQYNPKIFIEYGKKLGLRYFIGNSANLDESIEYDNNFIYAPSVYWIDRISLHPSDFDIEQLVMEAKSRPIIVLMHPIWWTWRKDVRRRFDQIISKTEFTPLEKLLKESQ